MMALFVVYILYLAEKKMGYAGYFRLECGTKITDIDCLRYLAERDKGVYYDAVDNDTVSKIRYCS